ncbi:MAG: hypothetical protein MK212_17460, partial [Saprospiraceae bacterium]|nr:hypothetical protein [Saprospiraceae bacterium]
DSIKNKSFLNNFYAKDGWELLLPSITLMIICPSILVYIVSNHGVSKDNLVSVFCYSSMLISITFGLIFYIRSEIDLTQNGIRAKGIIYEKFLTSEDDWLVKAVFDYENEQYYTYPFEDEENKLIVGDTVTVLFSKIHPNNNKILDN